MVASSLAFGLLNTLALVTAWMCYRAFFPSDRLHDACIRIAVIAFAIVAGCGLLLGSLKLLNSAAYGAVLLLLFSVLARVNTRIVPAVPLPRTALGRFHPGVVLVVPLLLLVLCYGLTHPPVAYDSLTYHLFFPARWLQAHQISIIPTPFGDQAPAYAPSDGELFFLWLMLPFHSDVLARAGQFPFYGLAALTLYGLARRLGSPPPHAIYAGALFLLSRPIVEQAVGADIDLVFAAMFLATVYFGVTASDTGRRSDVVLFGMSLGLCLGTKYLGVIYSPLLLVFLFARRIRRQAAWALPGIAALAAPWYLRNWLIAGTPLYPVSLSVAGLTLAPGAWGRAVSTQNWAHLTDLRLLPGIVRTGAFGADLLWAWTPFALLGAWALARARHWLALALGIVFPIAMGAIYWYVVPFNDATDTRYLFAGVGLAMLLAPAAFRIHERLEPFLHAAFAGAILWLVAFSSQPLIEGRHLILYGAIAGLITVCWPALSRRQVLAAVSFAALCLAIGFWSVRRCPPAGCELVAVASFNRPTMFAGWEWIEQHAKGVNIAYSGNNVPYRLLGRDLENRVYYVNIDRHLDWRYHDYERAARRRLDFTPPQRPNPPYFRQFANYEEWLQSLKSLDIAYVFLTRLSTLMEDDYRRDADGFPIEATWAAEHGDAFTPAYENAEVKIYAFQR